MVFLDRTLPSLAENLALDEALLLAAESGAGGEILRFWEWPKLAVVLGAGGKLAEDVDEDACRADGVPIARRSSGGGTVLLSRGCLLFSLVLSYARSPQLREVRRSYQFILEKTGSAMGGTHAGISDLAIGSRKFSGNAQHRKQRFLLHHGTLLCDFDIAQVRRYLRLPARQPDYRQGRDHGSFLTNLAMPLSQIQATLRSAWGAEKPASSCPIALVTELVNAKYTQPDWVHKR